MPKIVGVFGILAAFLILAYYSVVSGWIMKYLASYTVSMQPPADFDAFIGGTWAPIAWHLVFMGLTALICLFGIKGIERTSKAMMPALLVLLLIILVRAVTLPGAGEGLSFIFTPRGSSFHLSSISTALGQVFYSLSLCMGVINDGSYLNKKGQYPCKLSDGSRPDTSIALLAGMAVFPAVFSFGLEPGQGPSLIFGTLPKVFSCLWEVSSPYCFFCCCFLRR